MNDLVAIEQVLLIRDKRKSLMFGPALWAAMREVESFYNTEEDRIKVHRSYASEKIPRGLIPGQSGIPAGFGALWSILDALAGAQKNQQEEVAKEQIVPGDSPEVWTDSAGKFAHTYDADVIAHKVGKVLREDNRKGTPVVVTDQELTPPKDFRYIIWGGGRDGSVVSSAPTDPKYWGIDNPDRVSIIKHRVRTACMSVVGTYLGLSRCENYRCFLFREVDSVVALDTMVELGAEHDIGDLSGRGFKVVVTDPSKVQQMIENPLPYQESFYSA